MSKVDIELSQAGLIIKIYLFTFKKAGKPTGYG